jgi:hypothetical protein
LPFTVIDTAVIGILLKVSQGLCDAVGPVVMVLFRPSVGPETRGVNVDAPKRAH